MSAADWLGRVVPAVRLRHGPGWWECRCGTEWFDARRRSLLGPKSDGPTWSDCRVCSHPLGRWFGYLLQTGHASPWWITYVPRFVLNDYYREARAVRKRVDKILNRPRSDTVDPTDV